jgi:TM2 domain-containing membrane protein YozV
MREPSDKSRGLALGFALLGGFLGLHRFYVGKIGTGILMLLTGGGAGIWWIIDVVNVAAGGFRDRAGRRVAVWGFEEPDYAELAEDEVADELDALNEDLDEVTRRLEAAERQLGGRSAFPR